MIAPEATSRVALRVVLLLACLAVLGGCGEAIVFPSTGTIYGDVVDETDAPAAGIEIVIEGTRLAAVTDSRGRFIVNGVPAVDATGMGRQYVIRGAGTWRGVDVGFLLDHFKVKGQQSYGTGRVVVREVGAVRGSVVLDGEVADHSGTSVQLEGTSLMAVTRSDGSYLIARVPPHSGYRLVCAHDGFAESVVDSALGADAIIVQSNRTTEVGAIVLSRERMTAPHGLAR